MLLSVMDEEATSLTEELNQRLAKFAMIYRRKVIDDYAPYGLPVSSIVAVQAIAQGADTPSKIADMLNLERSHVTVILNRLQLKGYIKREVSENDARYVHVAFTEKGRDMLRHINEAQMQRLAPFVAALSASELRHFSTQLTDLVGKLEGR